MINSELNEYIKHYLEKDITQRAIMLTADWGTGKSYYVQSILTPYLKTLDHDCISVSLYGLNTLSDLSKSIYLETRFKALSKKSEKSTTGQVIAKTIGKGIVSFFGIDLSVKDEDMSKIYESIDLSKKLIILEDVERTNIDILELFGFVNNLVEQDKIKVLLIANENEIMRFMKNDSADNDTDKSQYDSAAKEYMKIKEKTVSDTIQFYCDYDNAIRNITEKFTALNIINQKDMIETICDIMEKVENHNLRSLIYACQKTVDLLTDDEIKANENFYKAVFYSILAYTLKSKAGEVKEWKDAYKLSEDLGTYKYPLHRFSYDYIRWQKIDKVEIVCAKNAYEYENKLKESHEIIKDDLENIKTYYRTSEKKVRDSVVKLRNELEKGDDFLKVDGGSLASYLIAIRKLIGNDDDIDKCLKLLKHNIFTSNEYYDEFRIFRTGIELGSEEEKKQFMQFKNDILEIMSVKKSKNLEMSYDLDREEDQIQGMWGSTHDNIHKYLAEKSFMKYVNIDELINLLRKCDAGNIELIRTRFMYLYDATNIKEYFSGDKNAIIKLIEEINQIVNDECFDKIQKMQLEYFIKNLEKIDRKL